MKDADHGCLADFTQTVDLVTRNYAGFADKVERKGLDGLNTFTEQIHKSIQSGVTAADCDQAVGRWLDWFADGHVTLHGATGKFPQRPAPAKPTGEEALPNGQSTPQGFYLRIPSFSIQHKAAVYRIIQANAEVIGSSPLLLVDLRGNGGGADATYDALLPLVYTKPIRYVGVDVLATPDNAAAWERILADIPPEQTEIIGRIKDVVSKMKAAPVGFMSLGEDDVITLPVTPSAPKRVVVIVDRFCASSCEQFLLAVQQSERSTIMGEPTAGVLDYANVREYPLASGKRVVSFATTRSRRLPQHPVDGVGIKPSVMLDETRLRNATAADLMEIASSERVNTNNPLHR